MSAAGKRHMGMVAQLPCACCGAHGVHVHHIREGQGMAQRASDFLTIPLCPDCHVGPLGPHAPLFLWKHLGNDAHWRMDALLGGFDE